jgi:hypothetical protein
MNRKRENRMSLKDPFATYIARWRGFLGHWRRKQPAPALAPPPGESEFNLLALELFALQFAHNPVYRRFCMARRATPATVSHWREIPAAPTSAFKEFALTSLPEDRRTAVFHSSGTTGHKPSRHYHDAESLAVYHDSLLAWFPPHLLPESVWKANTDDHASPCSPLSADGPDTGLGRRWPLIVLTPDPVQAPHSSLVDMFETVRRVFGDGDSVYAGRLDSEGAWWLDEEGVLTAFRLAMDRQSPVVVMGTAFGFVHLLEFMTAQAMDLVLPPGSRVMETGGYKGRSRALLKAELHREISRHLGIAPGDIICEYGMCELSSQAYDGTVSAQTLNNIVQGPVDNTGDETRIFQFPPWARASVVSPEDGREVAEGETGLLRICDLANVRSVLAVQTEDLAVRRGDGFSWVGRAAEAAPRGCSLMTATNGHPE